MYYFILCYLSLNNCEIRLFYYYLVLLPRNYQQNQWCVVHVCDVCKYHGPLNKRAITKKNLDLLKLRGQGYDGAANMSDLYIRYATSNK
jgi:hypothetical protein